MSTWKTCRGVERDAEKVSGSLGFREVAPEELLDDYPKLETGCEV